LIQARVIRAGGWGCKCDLGKFSSAPCTEFAGCLRAHVFCSLLSEVVGGIVLPYTKVNQAVLFSFCSWLLVGL